LERFPKDGGIFPVKLFELRALGGSVVLNKADKAPKKKKKKKKKKNPIFIHEVL
jgi:hypothetical protein